MSALTVGTAIRCERATPSRGTWPRFAGRTGTVVTINRRDGEVGISFGDGTHVDAWFLPSELVATGGAHVLHVAVSDETGSGVLG